jgi:hypothetical protein
MKGSQRGVGWLALTMSEFEGAFHGGSSGCFVYNWIDDAHGDSSPEGLKETEWLTD